MKEAYLRYYTPLVQRFCQTMRDGNHPGLENLSQPFLPLFGKNYEASAFKLLIVGQDSKYWGNAAHFIERELESPGQELASIFHEIEDFKFRGYGKNTHSFFGFAMALLASVHGMPDWRVLKWGGHEDVLSSFAWANANAVEFLSSKRKHPVPKASWEAARAASAHLDRFHHMLEILKPRVVLLTMKSLNAAEFFDGCTLIPVESTDPHIRQFRIEGHEVDIFHTYHPGYMRNVGGPWAFLGRLRETLRQSGLAPEFPKFVSENDDTTEVVRFLMRSAPRPDTSRERKYEFVTWVAEELTKRGAFMSVPKLVEMANELGYRTNYGTSYSKGRGSYRLVRGAYHRHAATNPEKAAKIAGSFRKPDFTYAY